VPIEGFSPPTFVCRQGASAKISGKSQLQLSCNWEDIKLQAAVWCQAEESWVVAMSKMDGKKGCSHREYSMENVRLAKARAALRASSKLMRRSLNLDWIVGVLVL
jgi:hypothetical protein